MNGMVTCVPWGDASNVLHAAGLENDETSSALGKSTQVGQVPVRHEAIHG